MQEPREVDTSRMHTVYGKYIRKDSPLLGGDPILKPEDALRSVYNDIAQGRSPEIDDDIDFEGDESPIYCLLRLFKMLLQVILKLN